MERLRLPQDTDLCLRDGFWNLRWRDEAIDPNLVDPAARESIFSRFEANLRVPQSMMTIADFVQNSFVPEHVATKGPAGRTHFRAMLKHVLTPEEVDRIFQVETKRPRTKLKAVPGWPYLGSVRLCDIQPDHLQKLISAASARGYSPQTVVHIRNVVTAIFEHARRKRWFTADNPGSLVTLPRMIRKEAHTLTLAQAKEVLGAMRHPEKEMTLLAILTRMNVAEICGLQWKRVNLTGDWIHADGEPLPPHSIAVRKQWRRAELCSVGRQSRSRNLPIPAPLLPILLELSQRAKFTGPDDFVLVSRTGTPVNQENVAVHRLRRIGRSLNMPWLTWQVLGRTCTNLANELGTHLLGEDAIG